MKEKSNLVFTFSQCFTLVQGFCKCRVSSVRGTDSKPYNKDSIKGRDPSSANGWRQGREAINGQCHFGGSEGDRRK